MAESKLPALAGPARGALIAGGHAAVPGCAA